MRGKKFEIILTASILFLSLIMPACCKGKIIYVDSGATGANDGTNWADSYNFLQDALADANTAEKPVNIFVAKGIYKPDQGATITLGDRSETFQLINGISIFGSYAGFGEADPNARDINQHETILSGDLSNDDMENLNDPGSEASRAENSYNVVTSSGVDETAVLDGFTITGGNANVSTNSDGAGLLNEYGSPQVINCTFIKNLAQDGGGIYNYYSSLTLLNCTFTQNLSENSGGGIYNYRSNININNCTFEENLSNHGGGGIRSRRSSLRLTDCTFVGNLASNGAGLHSYGADESSTDETSEDYQSTPILVNCTFINNSAEYKGGGLYCSDSKPSLNNCTFSENTAGHGGGGICFDDSEPNLTGCSINKNLSYYGGGMYNDNSSLTLTCCKLIANEGYDYGGGMYNINNSNLSLKNCIVVANWTNSYGGGMSSNQSNLTLTNCTFAQNSAQDGSVIAFNSQDQIGQSTAGIINCILWEGGNLVWINDQSNIVISNSNIRGGWSGTGNIDADPLFVDPNGPDNIPGTKDDDLRLSPSSPCVDAGDPNYIPEPNETDLAGNPRLQYGCVDMGAYEFQGFIYVDDDASEDPGPADMLVSDPLENGTETHPMDSIQEAIDMTKDGYTVLVQGGVYGEPIDFKGKAITVTSGSDIAVLETPGDYAVSFLSAEGPDSILKNFVIRNSVAAVFIPGSSPTIRNLTAVNNEYGITAYTWAEPDISNCIFWNNSEADLFQCEARYSCIEHGDQGQGEGNISADPLFVDAENGDYHLRSEGWCWSTKTKSWTYDYVTSPCIDAGDPSSPLGDEPMSVPRDPNNEYGINLYINMGAYGGTGQASIPPYNWLASE